jgi:uncharacterized membrane protein YraQ (UPF0718 family)
MDFFSLAIKSSNQVLQTLAHNWQYLLLSVVIAVLLKLYVNANKISAFLTRYRSAGVAAATAVAVGTPLCSCGTTAVVLGMMAGALPWAPIIAFMVSSPLTSPEGLVYTAGLFGWTFSIAFFVASIILGLAAGGIAGLIESRGWLANQTRLNTSLVSNKAPTLISSSAVSVASGFVPMASVVTPQLAVNPVSSCTWASPTVEVVSPSRESKIREFAFTFFKDGKRLLIMFLGFAFIGYFLNGLIPSSWISALFGGENIYNVPLAATLSLPFYINSEASLPLIRAMLDNGMSQGAAMAFLIAGSGTSIGAITGALTIARWRVIALVVIILWTGAIASGLAFDLWLAA